MHKININTGGHVWEKQNLVTVGAGKTSSYDKVKCAKCGITAKRINLEQVLVDGRIAFRRVMKCDGLSVAKRIRITQCGAFGKEFANLTQGSIHDVIEPPAGESDNRGVWVQGVRVPVLVLYGEFNLIE